MDHSALNYRATIAWLYDLQFVGIKMGLDNIRSLTTFWGNPQLRYPVIHIAGTNGKGSTAAFITSALRAAGYRTGLYTSPHLVDFSERIRVDTNPISTERVVEYTRILRPEIERLQATFFEATTAMAFRYFADEQVDVAVVETGLGGRLDASNVVEPVLTVITSIGIDHTEFLGTTLASIAAEKAGIIKQGVPCVTPNSKPEVLDQLQRHAAMRNAALIRVDVTDSTPLLHDVDRMESPMPGFPAPVSIGLVGAHQVENAATAVTALRVLAEHGFSALNDASIAEGLARPREGSGLRGRLERLQMQPELVIDVAHNPDGVAALLRCWSSFRDMKNTDIFLGVLKSKDLRAILGLLPRYALRSVTLVQVQSHEARSLDDMLTIARDAGIPVEGADDVHTCIRQRLQSANGASILLFGSHVLVGSFLAEWEK
ncbi:MAG: bifunctional folylpolyglutamate synthase/dihydrofolate synthase [Bacteroidetes bacterium]|nr:bifunctional folylpolyglutamate synthase/dihydrofolate synthase [Bacteroidota bacterium]